MKRNIITLAIAGSLVSATPALAMSGNTAHRIAHDYVAIRAAQTGGKAFPRVVCDRLSKHAVRCFAADVLPDRVENWRVTVTDPKLNGYGVGVTIRPIGATR